MRLVVVQYNGHIGGSWKIKENFTRKSIILQICEIRLKKECKCQI